MPSRTSRRIAARGTRPSPWDCPPAVSECVSPRVGRSRPCPPILRRRAGPDRRRICRSFPSCAAGHSIVPTTLPSLERLRRDDDDVLRHEDVVQRDADLDRLLARPRAWPHRAPARRRSRAATSRPRGVPPRAPPPSAASRPRLAKIASRWGTRPGAAVEEAHDDGVCSVRSGHDVEHLVAARAAGRVDGVQQRRPVRGARGRRRRRAATPRVDRFAVEQRNRVAMDRAGLQCPLHARCPRQHGGLLDRRRREQTVEDVEEHPRVEWKDDPAKLRGFSAVFLNEACAGPERERIPAPGGARTHAPGRPRGPTGRGCAGALELTRPSSSAPRRRDRASGRAVRR